MAEGPNGPGERFAATKRYTRIRVYGERDEAREALSRFVPLPGARRSADGKRYVAGPLLSRLGNDYFFPFLPFFLSFLLFLPFLATPITPLPDRKVNEMLTEKRQRIIDRYRVSNTL